MAWPYACRVLCSVLRAPLVHVAALCVAAGLVGCRAVDHAQVDLLERELRQQEDYIYELENYVMTYSEKLRECRACQTPATPQIKPPAESAAPRRRVEPVPVAPPPAASRRAADRPATPPRDAFDETEVSPAEPPAAPPEETVPRPASPYELDAPELDLGPMGALPWKSTAPLTAALPRDATPELLEIPDPADYQFDQRDEAAPASVAALAAAAEDYLDADALAQPVAAATTTQADSEPLGQTLPPAAEPERLVPQRLSIRQLFAEGADGASESPASLLAVVEALSDADEPVDADGEVSLMIMAGPSQEELQRVQRWDFTADEAQSAWQSSHLGDGLHLELPLDAAALPEGPLELWARLVRPDGERLLVRLPFEVDELTSLADAQAAPRAPIDEQPRDALAGGARLAQADADAAPPTVAAAPATQWRPSNERIDAVQVQSYASTLDGRSGGGWTRQQRPETASRPAPAADRAPPRWQQGATSPEGGSAWLPRR